MKALKEFSLPLIAVSVLILSLSVSIKLLRNDPLPTGSEFSIIQLGDMQRNQFLVDKKNGRIWQKVCAGKVESASCEGELIWDEMYVSNLTPQDSEVTKVYLGGMYARAIDEQHEKAAATKLAPAPPPKGEISIVPADLMSAQKFCNSALPPGTTGKKYKDCISQYAYSTGR